MTRLRPMEVIDRLDEAIKKLRTAYEKYFAGIDRIPPLKDRTDIKRDLRRLITSGTHNTAMRFRINSLQSTLVTYEQYWDRITRRIEEGTFHRDQSRLKRKTEAAAAEENQAAAEENQAAPEKKPAEAKKKTPAAATKDYPASLHKLHDAFTKARQQSGDARPVSIDALASTVKKQMAAIKQKYKCKRVEFKVSVKDGKAILKAVPK